MELLLDFTSVLYPVIRNREITERRMLDMKMKKILAAGLAVMMMGQAVRSQWYQEKMDLVQEARL